MTKITQEDAINLQSLIESYQVNYRILTSIFYTMSCKGSTPDYVRLRFILINTRNMKRLINFGLLSGILSPLSNNGMQTLDQDWTSNSPSRLWTRLLPTQPDFTKLTWLRGLMRERESGRKIWWCGQLEVIVKEWPTQPYPWKWVRDKS